MFSKKIRDLMIEQDISLQKLADTSGVPSGWEAAFAQQKRTHCEQAGIKNQLR